MANRPSNTPLDDGFNYVAAAIRQRDIVYISVTSPRMQAKQLPFAAIFDHDQVEFCLMGSLRWNCVSLCAAVHPLPQMIALGAYGQVKVFGSEQDFEERVIPEDLEFREVRTIDGMAYACAMDRKVYRREGARNWTPLHADMPARPAPDFVFGFESIHGFGHDDLYAVGWHGEIWHFDGQAWEQEASPTNLLLTRVYCAPDGNVYACGLGGTLLKGRKGQWTVLADNALDTDLWDLEWFDDRLWVSSLSMLCTLEADGLQPVIFDDDAPSTFGHLDARDGILWTVGSDDILQFDGHGWERIA